MTAAIVTTTNHSPANLPSYTTRRIANAHAAMINALARVGGEEIHWGARNGAHLDTSRLALSTLPDPRMFGRVAEGGDRPQLGVVALIDSSGSMSDSAAGGGTRRCAARAIACGIVSAGESLGIPVTVGHHGATGQLVQISAQRTTAAVLDAPCYGSNLDAPAVEAFLKAVELPAERVVFVLICDGAPCYERGMDRGAIARSLGALARNGHSFVLAYIGEDDEGLARAAQDWGGARVADCRRGPAALAPAVIAAVATARQS